MRIGYLVPEFPSQTHIFFWREIQALQSLGAEIQLLSTRRPLKPSRHSFAKAAQEATFYLFPPRWLEAICYLALRPLLSLRMLFYIFRIENTKFKRKMRLTGLMLCAADLLRHATKQRIEHVHGHSCADVGHLLALAALTGRLPFSLTLHGDLPVYGTGHRAKFKRAKFIAVVTFALQKQVETTCGVSVERLPVIRMGVDVTRFKPKFKQILGPLHLVTVARLAECKGHEFALRAMRVAVDQGLNIRYTIVGEGEHRPSIEARIQELKLQEQVKLVGTASEEEVLNYLQAADVFVLPSVGIGEAAPVSVMEAMSCGLPVVSSIIGGTPELITPNLNGYLVKQADVGGLAAAFLSLGNDPELRMQMGQKARETAEQRFSAQMFAQELYDTIRKPARETETQRA